LYDGLDYFILCAVRFTRPVTVCWMWSQFNTLAYVFLRPVTWLCSHFLSLLATQDERSVTWTSTRKEQLSYCFQSGGGGYLSTNSKNYFKQTLHFFGKQTFVKGRWWPSSIHQLCFVHLWLWST
jgi:hypothetical protein